MCHQRSTLPSTALALLLASAILDPHPIAAQSTSINQRRTAAQATITGSRRYDGAFGATGTSGVCGEIPKEASLTGVASFVVEFPSDVTGNQSITAIAFGSNQLVQGATRATEFRLMVGVRLSNGGRPPNYVLNTDTRNASTGIATLTKQGAETTLKVTGRNEVGESIELIVTCS